ncbi:retrovirus-related pol polyprotein from transposon TNT 1-94 [Tanacetum coccineum]
MDNEIDLEKKIKELDNIVYKVGQSAQTVHMLTKPQVFYDDTHKQALGYQNLFYLKKAQQIKPTMYDGSVISSQHAVIPVIDDEETLILEELNRLSEDFGKRFVPQQELSTKKAFWFQTSNPNTEQSDISLVRIEAPSELPKKGNGGLKVVFLNEIIPFLKTLKDIFDVFDKDLLNEVTEVQTVSNQMEVVVQQCSIFKDQFDSIKKTRVRSKEQSESLISQLNSKSVENADLKAQIQDKVFVITSLKHDLQKLKGKENVENAAQIPNATTIVPGMFKLDLDPLAPRYSSRNSQPLNNALYFSCKHSKRIHELLVYVRDTCPNANKPSEKLLVVTPMNKVKKVRIEEFFTSASEHCLKAIKRMIVRNSCPKTRITSTKVVPLKETTSHSVETQKPVIKVYSRKPKLVKSVDSSKQSKTIESRNANNLEPNHSWGSNVTYVPSSSSLVNDWLSRLFGNDQIAKIVGYGDYQLGNVTISRKNACFIRNLDGVDLLLGSRDTNSYIISLDDMLKTSPICLLSKASKTKSWLWHRRLAHLNFGTLNQLDKDGLARGIPKLKFKKDHMCSACALGKRKKPSHQPKAEDTNQEKLYLLYMDLCGPMRVESINGKKYILLMHDKKPDLSFLHVFGSLCYSTNDSEDLGKLNAKADIVQVATTPRAVDIADSPVSTLIDQDAPPTSIPSTQEQEQSTIISQGVEESPKTPHFNDDSLHETLHEDSTSQGSSSYVRPSHTPFELLSKWTKNHPIANVIRDPSHSVSTKKQLQNDAMWCYFDA